MKRWFVSISNSAKLLTVLAIACTSLAQCARSHLRQDDQLVRLDNRFKYVGKALEFQGHNQPFSPVDQPCFQLKGTPPPELPREPQATPLDLEAQPQAVRPMHIPAE